MSQTISLPTSRTMNPATIQTVARANGVTWPVTLLMVSFVIPWLVQVGPVVLSMHRVVLIFLTIPCVFDWLSGRCGKIRLADIALLMFCAWCALSLDIIHGEGVALEAGGVMFLETFGAYLIARRYIRSAGQFKHLIRVAFAIIACLLPFAAFESFTGFNLGRNLFAAILPTYEPMFLNDMRAGMTRAMVVLEHPILLGLYTGCFLATVHIALGREKSFPNRWLCSAIVIGTAFFSLSSAPIGAMFLQILLISWNWLFRNYRWRWKLLWGLAIASYILIDLLSSQTPIEFYITRFTFDSRTAWYRILIWQYGIASVWAHPLFGVGFGEWARAYFMSSSIDNFWLIVPLRHGLPAGILLYFAFLSIYLQVAFSRQSTPLREDYKTAYLITMTALFLIGWSVHFWGPPYVLLMFLMGSGIWLLEPDAASALDSGNTAEPRNLRGGIAVAHRAIARVRSPARPAAM